MKYDEKKHIELLKKVFNKAKSQKLIANDLNISLSTLKNWLSKYPNFKQAWKNLLIDVKSIEVKPLTKKGKLHFEAKNNNHKVVLKNE